MAARKRRRAKSRESPATVAAPTVGEFIRYHAPSLDEPRWPPDVFGVVSLLLQRSGAYTSVVNAWPPRWASNAEAWREGIRDIGKEWRNAAVSVGSPLPRRVEEWWTTVQRSENCAVSAIASDKSLREALLQLSAAADEACQGVGVPTGGDEEPEDTFRTTARNLLRERRSLGREISPDRLWVLPKLHTPQVGMTIRSLSHYLAAIPAADVRPEWHTILGSEFDRRLNLLLVPWPLEVLPVQFQEKRTDDLRAMDEKFGFFRFAPRQRPDETADALGELIEAADEVVGHIDGVILPETAIEEKRYRDLVTHVAEVKRRIVIVGFVGSTDLGFASNEFAVHVPVQVQESVARVGPSHKHHRWKLDRSQILQYGLGGTLDPTRGWWEHISLGERKVFFVSLKWWLTVCVLICEDLAR